MCTQARPSATTARLTAERVRASYNPRAKTATCSGRCPVPRLQAVTSLLVTIHFPIAGWGGMFTRGERRVLPTCCAVLCWAARCLLCTAYGHQCAGHLRKPAACTSAPPLIPASSRPPSPPGNPNKTEEEYYISDYTKEEQEQGLHRAVLNWVRRGWAWSCQLAMPRFMSAQSGWACAPQPISGGWDMCCRTALAPTPPHPPTHPPTTYPTCYLAQATSGPPNSETKCEAPLSSADQRV